MDVTALATALRFVGVLVLGCARVGLGVVVVEVTPTTARASAVGLCAAHDAIGEILATLMTAVVGLFCLGFIQQTGLACISFTALSSIFFLALKKKSFINGDFLLGFLLPFSFAGLTPRHTRHHLNAYWSLSSYYSLYLTPRH